MISSTLVVGATEGDTVGAIVGLWDGIFDGVDEGINVVGTNVGFAVVGGLDEGVFVGYCVG